MKRGISAFFRYARLRHSAYHAKMAGAPRGFQSRDPTLSGGGRFTNVFRELDRTTIWFRENVRNRLRDRTEVLLATVLFRMFNRVEVGEAIFCQNLLPMGRFKHDGGLTAWDTFLATGDTETLKQSIIAACGSGPYTTGAYIVSSPPMYSKLDGVLRIVHAFNRGAAEWCGLGAGVYDTMNWRGSEGAGEMMLANQGDVTLEETWEWFRQFSYLGPFHSYEIVTDLRHTDLLFGAPDIMTWASPGPGARRGLNRVHGRDKKDHTVGREGLIEEMRELLACSKSEKCWPQPIITSRLKVPGLLADGYKIDGPCTQDAWPAWEMRDVEHTLCEFDKWCRVRDGEGRTRGVYR